MRIATGGISHETTALGNLYATLEVLRRGWLEGQTLREKNENTRTYQGGVIDEAKARNVDLVTAMHAGTVPSGLITREALETARDRLVELLWQAHEEAPLDGIVLTLHGAGRAEGYPDIEGEILGAIRKKFGWEIPVAVVLDLHGNISQDMMERADILVGVKCYPHVDEYEAARITLGLLWDRISSGKPVYKSMVKLPWLIAPAEGVTLSGAAQKVQQFCIARERENDRLLQATFFHGFPFGDTEFAGVTVVTNALSQEEADREAMAIAEYAWGIRREFAVPFYSADEAMDKALAMGEGPIIINESSDNPGGGAPGDGTHLLRVMLERNEVSAFGYICDPEVVQQAIAAGVGKTIACRLGGKTQAIHGEPVELEAAYVSHISDGRYIGQSPMGKGKHYNIGPVVCLQVGNVSIVVGTGRTQTMDEGPFLCGGVDWRKMRILALKSSQHFKGWWVDKVRGIVPCESPGIHCSNLRVFDFKNLHTEYFPLADAQWK